MMYVYLAILCVSWTLISLVLSFENSDSTFPVEIKQIQKEIQDPCHFPQTLKLLVYYENGSLFHELKLRKRQYNSFNENHVYTLRAKNDQGFALQEEKINLPKKSNAYFSEENPYDYVEMSCLQDVFLNSDIRYTGRLIRDNTLYKIDTSNHSNSYQVSAVPLNDLLTHDYRQLPGNNIVQRIKESFLLQNYKSRQRRQINLQRPYIIDVLVLIDHKIYLEWYERSRGHTPNEKEKEAKDNIRTYFSHFLNEVDLRYQGIKDTDLNFRVQVVAFIVADRRDSYPWTEVRKEFATPRELLNADEALKDFRLWINNTQNLPPHDHAILFTGYNLYTTTPNSVERKLHTAGLAFIGSMCRHGGDSVSVVEDHGGFQNIATAAHEIGHSLGALHDGENNVCNSYNRFIMSSTETLTTVPPDKRINQWHFSSCSLNYFRHFISSLTRDGYTCLTDSYQDLTSTSIPPPGQVYSADEQCKLIWGPESYLCRGSEFGDASSICTAMYCRDPSSGTDCVLHTAARGTSCGNKKWCDNGLCVISSKAPQINERCVLGDQPGIAFINKTCDELVNEYPQYCYEEKVRARCCSSCFKYYTWISGCEYGDRVYGCQEYHCQMTSDKNVTKNCCKTCSHGIRIPTTEKPNYSIRPITTDQQGHTNLGGQCKDMALVNGQDCQNFIFQHGRHICYDGLLESYCCESCSRVKDTYNADCMYGDRNPSFCSKQTNVTSYWCKTVSRHCCDTCNTSGATIVRWTLSLGLFLSFLTLLI